MYFYLKAHCQWTTSGLRTSRSMLSSSSNFEVPINTPLPTACSPSLRDMKSLSLKTAGVTTSFIYETDTSPARATATTGLRSDVFVPFHPIAQTHTAVLFALNVQPFDLCVWFIWGRCKHPNLNTRSLPTALQTWREQNPRGIYSSYISLLFNSLSPWKRGYWLKKKET